MEDLEHLLEKLRNNQCTPEEIRYLKELFQNETQVMSFLDEDLAKGNHSFDKTQQDAIWSKIKQEMPIPPFTTKKPIKVIKLVYRWASVAAALVLLMLLWRNLDILHPATTLVVENTQINHIQKLELPDGSRVWLNHGSKLSYSSSFRDSVRLVELDGEAFFEVQKDPQHPFIVKTNQIRTRVLGTSFNIKAYTTEDLITVALVEGKVQVEIVSESDTTLKYVALAPGGQLYFNKTAEIYATNNFASDAPYAWKNNIIYFDGADVRTVTETLQRWYNVRFTLQQDTLMKSELVYRYDTKQFSFEEVLNHITQVTDYKFQYVSDNEYLVVPK